MRGFTFDYTPSDKFDRPDEEVARNGSVYDRSTLASREKLSREVFLILADTDEFDVYSSLAMNHTSPPDILDRVVERFPELRGFAAINPSASADLKKTAPLAEQIESSIESFNRIIH